MRVSLQKYPHTYRPAELRDIDEARRGTALAVVVAERTSRKTASGVYATQQRGNSGAWSMRTGSEEEFQH